MKNKNILATGVSIIIAVIATYIGKFQNYIGSPMLALLIGMIVVNFSEFLDEDFKSGASSVSKKFLSLGIVLTGATLNFNQILGSGLKAMPLLLVNICIAFYVANTVGKKLDVTKNTSTLVASGTSICGGTAIATLSQIIKAKESEIAYAMTAIFLFDIFSALLYPYFATTLNLSHNQFGFLAGSSINDTSSVVAAESTYGVLNGIDSNLAVTIKLARTILLVLLVIVFTVINIKNQSISNNKKNSGGISYLIKSIADTFPKFIIAFLIMAILNTMGVFNGFSGSSIFFKNFSKFFITTALAGIGFKIQFKDILAKGLKPIVIGGITWLSLCISSLLFIFIFSNYVG